MDLEHSIITKLFSLEAKIHKPFLKGPNSNYFNPAGHVVCIVPTQLRLSNGRAAMEKMQMNGQGTSRFQ